MNYEQIAFLKDCYKIFKKNIYLLLTISVGVGIITYFLHTRNSITNRMKELYGMKVFLPVEEMLLISPIDKEYTFDVEAKYKMVVFYDSLSCSPCAYNNMYIWNDFIEEVHKANERVEFYFIMNPSKDNLNSLFQAMQSPSSFSEFILIDTLNAFTKANKMLPAEQIYHCMLLDSRNRIKLIGDPTRSNHLRDLYFKTILN
jgi:hypothetical protein